VTAYNWDAVPFRSEAQRRYLWANHPEVAREFADRTPKDARLPDHVKKAALSGAVAAMARFGLKQAGEELRLKIPDRTFHGFDAASKSEAAKGHAKRAGDYGDRRSSEDLARMLQAIELPPVPGASTASKNPLDRSTSWGPPSSTAAGDVGSRSGVGPSAFGGV
jgi:hypothetical protein